MRGRPISYGDITADKSPSPDRCIAPATCSSISTATGKRNLHGKPAAKVVSTMDTAADEIPVPGWQAWQSRQGEWYATRTDTRYPDDPPCGWAMTVHGRTAGQLWARVAWQIILDQRIARQDSQPLSM